MTHLEKIAQDLERKVYVDPMHGQIAKANFEYGVAQATIKADRILDDMLKNYAFGHDFAERQLFINRFNQRMKSED